MIHSKAAVPFHGNCLEGMAAGPAIEKRLGKKGQDHCLKMSLSGASKLNISRNAPTTHYIDAFTGCHIFGGGVMKAASHGGKGSSSF